MATKRHSYDDVVKLLRESELNLTAGDDVASACWSVGINDATYSRRITTGGSGLAGSDARSCRR